MGTNKPEGLPPGFEQCKSHDCARIPKEISVEPRIEAQPDSGWERGSGVEEASSLVAMEKGFS